MLVMQSERHKYPARFHSHNPPLLPSVPLIGVYRGLAYAKESHGLHLMWTIHMAELPLQKREKANIECEVTVQHSVVKMAFEGSRFSGDNIEIHNTIIGYATNMSWQQI